MKKTIVLLITATLVTLTLPLIAKTKIRKLTTAEIVDVNEVMTIMPDMKAWMEKVENSKDFKHTEKRSAKIMKDLEKFFRKVEKGEVVKTNGNPADPNDVMTVEWLDNITNRDRDYWSDPNIIQDIWDGKRCPLDGKLYAGVDPNE